MYGVFDAYELLTATYDYRPGAMSGPAGGYVPAAGG
jgi:hypothetical protein